MEMGWQPWGDAAAILGKKYETGAGGVAVNSRLVCASRGPHAPYECLSTRTIQSNWGMQTPCCDFLSPGASLLCLLS